MQGLKELCNRKVCLFGDLSSAGLALKVDKEEKLEEGNRVGMHTNDTRVHLQPQRKKRKLAFQIQAAIVTDTAIKVQALFIAHVEYYQCRLWSYNTPCNTWPTGQLAMARKREPSKHCATIMTIENRATHCTCECLCICVRAWFSGAHFTEEVQRSP